MSSVAIRQAVDDDIPFIFNSWLKTYYRSEVAKRLTWMRELVPYARVMDCKSIGERDKPNIYYVLQRELIKSILEVAYVHTAYYVDDPNLLIGWACAEPERKVLHYVCIKPDYHGLGIAKELIESFGFNSQNELIYTHRTEDLRNYYLPELWQYNPELTTE